MEIYRQSRNRLYWRDARENRMRLIAKPYQQLLITPQKPPSNCPAATHNTPETTQQLELQDSG